MFKKKQSPAPAPRSPTDTNTTAASARTTPAAAAEAVPLQPGASGVSPEDDIRARAHLLWEQAGSPAGDGVEFWVRAEHELRNPGA